MLQTIHEKLTGPFAITILGMLAVVFVFWGVNFVSVDSGPRATGLQVDGEDVRVEDLRRVYQEELNRYQVAFGAQEMPAEIKQRLQEQVLEGTIRRELMRQRTEDQRFRASDAEVLKSLQNIPAFQVDGKFSKDAYYATLRSANLDPANFEVQQRQQLAIAMLDRGLAASAFATPAELDRIAALRYETRDIAYAIVPVSKFIAAVNPDEAALAAYYQKNAKQFMTADQAALEYVELSLADVIAGVKVTDEALRGYYEQNKDRFVTVERRRASHILISVDKDEAAARKLAQQVFDRAKAGEDFAALARQYSQDSGSAQQGGDLGWAEKSFFVGPFADAVWAMKVGEFSGPVRSEFGYHVIRLDGIEGGQGKSFEEARAELDTEYRRSEAEKLFGDLQEKLDTDAFEAGGNLEQVARQLALPVRKVEVFTRTGGGDLGADPKLVSVVFDPEMTTGTMVRTVQLGEGRVVAVRVASFRKAEQRPLAEVRAQVLDGVRLEQARERAAAVASDLMKQLQAGGDWATLAAPYVATVAAGPSTTPRAVRRDDNSMPVEVIKAAFKTVRPAGAPGYGLATIPNGDAAVWAVTAAQTGMSTGLTEEQRSQFIAQVLDSVRTGDATLYLAEMRNHAKIKSNPKLFE